MSTSVRIPIAIVLSLCAVSPVWAGQKLGKSGGQKLLGASTTGTNRLTKAPVKAGAGWTKKVHAEDIAFEEVKPAASTTTHAAADKKGAQLLLPAHVAAADANTVAPAKRNVFQKVGGWLKRNFTIRSDVRTALKAVDAQRKQGLLGDAANTLVTKTVAPQGFLERWRTGSTRRALANDTMDLLKSRSKSADSTKNTEDAINGINTLKENGKLSFFGRLRAGSAERVAVDNTRQAIRDVTPKHERNFGKIDLQSARDDLGLIAKMKGADSRAYRRAEKMAVSRLNVTAEKLAKGGETEAVKAIFEQTSDLASYDAVKAKKTISLAAKNEANMHLSDALHLARSGDNAGAAESIVEAMKVKKSIGEDPESLFKGGGWFSKGRAISQLRQKLGPQIRDIENAPPAKKKVATTHADPDTSKVAVHAEPDTTKATLLTKHTLIKTQQADPSETDDPSMY